MTMVVLQIYSKSIRRKYKTTLFSKATLFILITFIVSIAFPFMFVYRSKGFWLKNDAFYEQPNVHFKRLYLLTALSNNNEPIICNNFPQFQQYSQLDVCNNVKVQEIDRNYDGKIDALHFYMTLDLAENVRLHAINLLLLLDYKLQTCPTNLETAAILQQVLPPHSTTLVTVSELVLSQSSPLLCSSEPYKTYNIILNENEEQSYKFENIFESYNDRNITTHLANLYTTIKTNPSNKFELRLKVKYPIHKIWYKTGFWQLIKWALIQYFPVYFMFFHLIKKVRNYVFDNRLVLYYEESPLKKKTE